MIHLGSENPGTRASLSELAHTSEVSPAFLSKVLQRLVKAGFIASRRGKRGGFEMLDRGREATLLEILDALDGIPALNVCLMNGNCHRSPWCPAHPVWKEAQDRMREVLGSASLAQLVAENRNGREVRRLSELRNEE
jgi:Rrf2 family protein